MDSLTHGLLGLAIGNLRRPDDNGRAVLLGCVLAAELPDLDYLWPASDPVLHALRAHRGITHALVFAPVVALAAAVLVKLLLRRASLRLVFVWSLFAVLFAHLLADAWTGWGTRLLLPVSEARVTLDWMLVVDPLFTLPLLVGALWGVRRRILVRSAVLTGFVVSLVYLGVRLTAKSVLTSRVEAAHPGAGVTVFPSWLGPTQWRYVAELPDRYAAGRVGLFSAPTPEALHARTPLTALSAPARASATVGEALAWARFPIVREETAGARRTIRVQDLRYHLRGEPTLGFRVELDEHGRVRQAYLERGGTARSLFERLRR